MDGTPGPPARIVLDWNHVAIGRVRRAAVHPRTRGVEHLVVALTAEAQGRLALAGAEVVIPVGMVHSLRPGEVVLDRALEALAALAADPALNGVERVGFVDHERTEVMDQARAQGCTRVMAKGQFSKELPALLAKLRS